MRRLLAQSLGRRLLLQPPRRALCTVRSASPPVEPPTRSQLVALALGTGVPFVGFGFADNFIMIVAGDQIDCTLGVKFGLSTLAAAGIGNTISDIVGISLGEVIESQTSKFLKEPKLSAEQMNLRSTRLCKGFASAAGITIGCVIGMFPLLFMSDRKAVFFDDDELEIFQNQFAPYGVSPQQFFELLKHGKWITAEAGSVLVRKGERMDSTIFLHSGAAQATSGYIGGGGVGDDGEICSIYEGRVRPEGFPPELSHLTRGCIIGGSALVEPELTGRPYPNTVAFTRRAKYLEWQTESLRAAMKDDKSIEAAVLATLYLDLVRGIREQRKLDRSIGASGVSGEGRAETLREYEVMLKAVLADGLVHPLEKLMVTEFANKHAVRDGEHFEVLRGLGWSAEEWERGVKADLTAARKERTGWNRRGDTGAPATTLPPSSPGEEVAAQVAAQAAAAAADPAPLPKRARRNLSRTYVTEYDDVGSATPVMTPAAAAYMESRLPSTSRAATDGDQSPRPEA